MTVEGDLFTAITQNASIYAQVAGRLYSNRLPPNATLPAITMREVSGQNIMQTMTAGKGLMYGTFMFDAWADDYLTLKAVRDAMVLGLNGLKTGSILSCKVTLSLDLYDDELEKFRQLVNVQVLYAIT
jgi:hypothetical protein